MPNPLLSLDSFLIDKGFQKISDKLELLGSSCYSAGAFLYTGAALGAFTSAGLGLQTDPSSWFFAVPGILMAFPAWRAYEMAAKPPEKVLPTDRLWWSTRTFNLSILGLMLSSAGSSPLHLNIYRGSFLLFTLGLYFMACTRKPPKKQEAPTKGRLFGKFKEGLG